MNNDLSPFQRASPTCNVACTERRHDFQSWSITGKTAAHQAVAKAIRRGVLFPQLCQLCLASGRVLAHHYLGYSPCHWLDVMWLCTRHHTMAHRIFRNSTRLRRKLRKQELTSEADLDTLVSDQPRATA